MIPRSISLSNFLSYREAHVDLSRGGIIALAGDNGAGKSALAVDALTWALWGDSRADSDDDLVRAGSEECQVSVVVDTASGLYLIARRRHLPKGKRAGVSALSLELLHVDDERHPIDNLTRPTIRETQEAIDRLLGMDGRTFINSACLVQGRADEFARAAPKDRKEVLVDILALGQWQHWAAVAHEGYRKVDALVKGSEAALDAADNMLAGWDTVQTDLAVARSDVSERAALFANRKQMLEEARVLAAAQRDRISERATLGAEVERLDELVQTERQQVEQLTTRIMAIPEEATVAVLAEKVATVKTKGDGWSDLADRFNRRSAVEAEINRWEAEVKSRETAGAEAEAVLIQLHAPADDFVPENCPTCGQPLDEGADSPSRVRVEKALTERRDQAMTQRGVIRNHATQKDVATGRLDQLRNELDGLPAIPSEDVTAARAALDHLPAVTGEHAAAVAQREGVAGLMEAIVARKDARDAAVVEGGTARERLTVLTVELEGAGDRQAALTSLEAEMENLTAGVAEASSRRDSLKGRADQLSAVKTAADIRRQEAATHRAEMELMAELDTALGVNGVQALLIDAAIPQIVQEANALLALMSAGTTIDLRTQRSGKTTGREIETLDLVVADGSGVRPYESYSGGERFRIDFATRIGLSQLLARRAASPCRTLIVDEGFGSQDGRGRMALLEALAIVENQFKLVLVITHLDDLQEYFPSIVRIEKTADGSTASLV